MKQSNIDNLDYLAVKLLKKVGIKSPNVKQRLLVSSVLTGTATIQPLAFESALTQREKACLLLAAKGKNLNQTAEILGLKPSSVKTLRGRLTLKLKAANISQAIFEGIRLGCIPPKRT
jgi:DNA-binding CsgD family transcriptional regulator